MDARKPRLLRALNALYEPTAAHAESAQSEPTDGPALSAVDRGLHVPWLSGPEDSWL
jgi:hypothetical protein